MYAKVAINKEYIQLCTEESKMYTSAHIVLDKNINKYVNTDFVAGNIAKSANILDSYKIKIGYNLKSQYKSVNSY